MEKLLKNKIVIIGVAVFLLFCFYIFSRSLKAGFMKNTDFAATVKIQEKVDKSAHLRTAALVDNAMDGATYLASPGFSVVVIILITLIATIDIKNKKIRLRGLMIPILFGLLTLGEIYGKVVVHHPSPPFQFIKHSVSLFPKDYINEQYSYPSGHAARAVFIAIISLVISLDKFKSILMKKKIFVTVGLIGIIYVGMVCISRIYLGHHWLSDVIGGWILGLGLGSFVYIFI
jgi:membrane-associated phospholipid phosphatase